MVLLKSVTIWARKLFCIWKFINLAQLNDSRTPHDNDSRCYLRFCNYDFLCNFDSGKLSLKSICRYQNSIKNHNSIKKKKKKNSMKDGKLLVFIYLFIIYSEYHMLWIFVRISLRWCDSDKYLQHNVSFDNPYH